MKSIPINKIGTLELEYNTLKYRLSLMDLKNDDINILEKNMKRKGKIIEQEPYYLVPFEIQIINSSVVYYYDMTQYKSYDYLRQYRFKEKLKYYKSLIEIAKQQNTTKVLWDRNNFVVDPYEEKIKSVVYETDDLKIYEKTDPFEGIKELILISLTTLNNIYGKPRRADFIDQDEQIIQFAESLIMKVESIDDIDNLIEIYIIDIESNQKKAKNQEKTPSNKEKRSFKNIFKNNLKEKQIETPQYSFSKNSKNINKKKSSNKTIIILGVVLVFAIVVNLLSHTQNNKATPVSKQTATQQTHKEIKSSPKMTNSKYNNQLVEAYRYYFKGNYNKSLSILKNIGVNNLGEDEQKLLKTLYNKTSTK